MNGYTQFLPAIDVNSVAPSGVTVDSLINGVMTDVDAGAVKGIAVHAQGGAANGTWQFSTIDGSTLANFGSVSSTNARLLNTGHRIRFVPKPGYTMILASSGLPTLTYRAWDQTKGIAGSTTSIPATGGTTAFSTATRVAKIRVNTAPVLTPAGRTLGTITSTKIFSTTVAALIELDRDLTAALKDRTVNGPFAKVLLWPSGARRAGPARHLGGRRRRSSFQAGRARSQRVRSAAAHRLSLLP